MNTEKTGELISTLRRERNLTQAELAELICVSDKAISRWETGRGFPDVNNLEALAESLDVTVAELLKGERIETPISKEDLNLASTESFSLAKALLKRKKYVNILIGFLVSLAVLTVAIVHLTSPIYIEDSNNALTIEKLSDGRIVAVLEEGVSGYELGTIEDPDAGDALTFISCYRTRFDQIRGKTSSDMVLIGEESEIGRVYYYPSKGGFDQLIYGDSSDSSSVGGIATLPRLIYNYWIIIGAGASVIGIIVYLVCRKKRFGRLAIKAAIIPIAFTASILLCLVGRFDEVYNAGFYFTGILLLTFILTALGWFLVYRDSHSSTSISGSGLKRDRVI